MVQCQNEKNNKCSSCLHGHKPFLEICSENRTLIIKGSFCAVFWYQVYKAPLLTEARVIYWIQLKTLLMRIPHSAYYTSNVLLHFLCLVK